MIAALRNAGRVWARDFESWKDYAIPSMVGTIAEPLLTFVAIGYGLGRLIDPIGGEAYVAFLAPGILAATAMNAAAFETTFGSFTRLTEQRTFEAIVRTPISVAEVVMGDILWAASKSVLGGAVVLAIMYAIGLAASPVALLALPVAFLIGLLFGALGMAYTAVAPSYAFFNYFFTLVVTVMYLFGGVFFPLDGLPEWARWAALALPLTHAVEILRAISDGRMPDDLAVHLAVLIGVTLPFLWLSVKLIDRRLIR